MEHTEKYTVTKWIMSQLAEVSLSAISRFLTNNNMKSVDIAEQHNRYTVEHSRRVIQAFIDTKKKIISKKHAFYNLQADAGNTSICYQVSTHIALMGYNVLVIDADPQAHLTAALGFSNKQRFPTLYDCIVGPLNINDIVQNIYQGLDCIPANLLLIELDRNFDQIAKREEMLSILLKPIEDKYDFIFVDTNPSISFLNRNIITFVDIINIVCETETKPYSLNAIRLLMNYLIEFFELMQMEPKAITIIPNKYEDKSHNSAEAMAELWNYYSNYIKKDFAVRKSEDMVTSAKISRPLAFFAKRNSIAMEDIVELILDLIKISKYTEVADNE